MVLQRQILLNASAVRRLLWLLLGLGHLPGLFAAWASLSVGGLESEAFGHTLLLTVTTVFFALKVCDVAFLRLCPGRRTLVAACLVVALLHVDLVRPNSESSAIPDLTALAATAWIAGTQVTVRRILARSFARIRSIEKDEVQPNPFAETVWFDAVGPHCWVLALTLFLLRAPPA